MAFPTGLVIGGIAIGGAVYLYVRSQKAKATGCDATCTSAGDPGGHSICVAACNAANGIVAAVLDSKGGAATFQAEENRRDTVNRGINGATDVAMPGGGNWGAAGLARAGSPIAYAAGKGIGPLGGTTLRYANGCTPYFGSPGWSKCGDGTLDMISSAIDAASGKNFGFTEDSLTAIPAQPSWAALQQWLAQRTQLSVTVKEYIVKGQIMTGQHDDPSTTGPDAANKWIVRGLPISCPAGQAPRSVALGALGQGINPDPVERCVDPINPNGSTQQSIGTCPVPDGFTYKYLPDGSYYIARLSAGELVNPGPCAGKATAVSTSGAGSHSLGVP